MLKLINQESNVSERAYHYMNVARVKGVINGNLVTTTFRGALQNATITFRVDQDEPGKGSRFIRAMFLLHFFRSPRLSITLYSTFNGAVLVAIRVGVRGEVIRERVSVLIRVGHNFVMVKRCLTPRSARTGPILSRRRVRGLLALTINVGVIKPTNLHRAGAVSNLFFIIPLGGCINPRNAAYVNQSLFYQGGVNGVNANARTDNKDHRNGGME